MKENYKLAIYLVFAQVLSLYLSMLDYYERIIKVKSPLL